MEEKTQESVQRAAETVGNTIVDVMDKLAGKKSDLKLTFRNLSMDTGIFQASVNGSVIVDVVLAKEERS